MYCPVCGAEIEMNLCHGRKGKKAIMLYCPVNGRHFRAFVNEPQIVTDVSNLQLSRDEVMNWWKCHSR